MTIFASEASHCDAENEALYRRVKAAQEGMKNLRMTLTRAHNTLANKLAAECDQFGVERSVIVPFYQRVKHVLDEEVYNDLDVNIVGPRPTAAERMLILQWLESKEKMIQDDKPVAAFAVYMGILVRMFLTTYKKTGKPEKGQPVLVYQEADYTAEEKLQLLESIHDTYRQLNHKSNGVIFKSTIRRIREFWEWEESERLQFVETHSTPDLLIYGTPFYRGAFDFIKRSGFYPIPLKARFEHMHVLARSGHGKTQLLENFIFNDIMRAHDERVGLCVIDGQGDLIKHIKHLNALAPLQDRVILIDPADSEYPFCLNPFDMASQLKDVDSPQQREEIYNNTLYLLNYVFNSLLGSGLTAKQRVIFNFMVRLLVSIEGATIHTMRLLLEDSEPFAPYIHQQDPLTRDFFLNQFNSATYNDTKFQILTRLYSILTTPALEKMFNTETNKLDLYQAMNEGSIILVDTNKQLLTADGHSLLGKYFVSLILQAAFKRKFIEEEDRTPFFVYMDEAHDYVDGKTDELLAQARKFKVGLVLANQFYGQMDTETRDSFKANTSIKLYGALNSKDRNAASNEIDAPVEMLSDLRSIDRKGAEYLLKVGNQAPVKVFTPFGIMGNAGQLPPEILDIIVEKNRQKYCVDASKISTAVTVAPPDIPDAKETPAGQPIQTPAFEEREAPTDGGFNPEAFEEL